MVPTQHELRQIAVKAGVDPRTVRRWLDGEFCRTVGTATAIQTAVTDLQLTHLAKGAKQTGPTAQRPKPRRPVVR